MFIRYWHLSTLQPGHLLITEYILISTPLPSPLSRWQLRGNKKKCVLWVTGLKFSAHIFLFFFSRKNIIFCILKYHFAFQNEKKIQKTSEKVLVSPVNLGRVGVTLNIGLFYLALLGY